MAMIHYQDSIETYKRNCKYHVETVYHRGTIMSQQRYDCPYFSLVVEPYRDDLVLDALENHEIHSNNIRLLRQGTGIVNAIATGAQTRAGNILVSDTDDGVGVDQSYIDGFKIATKKFALKGVIAKIELHATPTMTYGQRVLSMVNAMEQVLSMAPGKYEPVYDAYDWANTYLGRFDIESLPSGGYSEFVGCQISA